MANQRGFGLAAAKPVIEIMMRARRDAQGASVRLLELGLNHPFDRMHVKNCATRARAEAEDGGADLVAEAEEEEGDRGRETERVRTRFSQREAAAMVLSQSCHLVHRRTIQATLKTCGAVDGSFSEFWTVSCTWLNDFCVSAHDVGCSV